MSRLTVSGLADFFRSELARLNLEASELRAESDRFLEFLTKMNSSERLLRADEAVAPEVFEKAQGFIEQRKRHVPIQYILGETYFYAMHYLVREGVLIPRADTEILVECVLKESSKGEPLCIGEIGIGSGIVAVTVLKHRPNVVFLACDLEARAIALSEENAGMHGLLSRLSLQCKDWQSWLPAVISDLDMLVSNPPYIAPTDEPSLDPEVRLHEPHLALFGGGADGLGFYREIAAFNFPRSIPAFFEIGFGQSKDVLQIFEQNFWTDLRVYQDLSGIDRVVGGLSPDKMRR